MKKFLLLIFVSILSLLSVSARKTGLHKFHSDAKDYLNIGVGPNYMFADLGGADFNNMWVTEWDFLYTRPSVFVGYEHAFNNYVGLRLQLMYNMFGGNDDDSRNEAREYEYSTNSFEPSLQFMYYFYRGSWGRTTFDVYAYAGISYSWYWTKWRCMVGGEPAQNRNPTMGRHPDSDIPNQANVEYDEDDEMYKYHSGCWQIPFGIGIRFPVTPKLSLGADFGWRYAFGKYADYMDGMQTWWSDMNDTYAVLTFTLSYRLQGTQDCYAKYGRSQFRHFNHSR